MTKGYELAFPTTIQSGLSKRELFAAMALQGLNASLASDKQVSIIMDAARELGVAAHVAIAMMAARSADALIAELAKEKS
jgi:hypothetical protein